MTDGEQSILRQVLRCRFLGNSQQRVRKSPGGPLGKGAPLSGVLVGEEPLSWVYKRPWFRRETGLLRNHRELGNRREGVMARNTRNKECTWDEDSVPKQCQA